LGADILEHLYPTLHPELPSSTFLFLSPDAFGRPLGPAALSTL
jgi:hypothetical protein